MSDAAYRDALPFIARTYSRKFGVTIEVKGTHAYSTSNSIVIPELDLQDQTLARLTYGFLAHEAGHLRFSDFEQCEALGNEVLLRLVNSLEDGRIEYLMARNFVGVYENLELLNQCLLRDNHRLLLSGQIWSKLDLLTTTLVLLSHERFNNYPGVSLIKRDYLNELSCLFNEADLNDIMAQTYRLPQCRNTGDVIAIARDIYAILQRPTCLIPNFTRFALRYQLSSHYDLENCRSLAAGYGQDFSAPVICPSPDLKLRAASELVSAAGLSATVAELFSDYIPDFIAPRAPSFMPQNNSAALLSRVGRLALSASKALSDESAGNSRESARLFARSRAQREQSALNLGRALSELIPVLSTKDAQSLAVRQELSARSAALPEPKPPERTPLELSALAHALSCNPESYDVHLGLDPSTTVPFYGVTATPSPYQGPELTRQAWAQAVSCAQAHYDDTPQRSEPELPAELAALEAQWARDRSDERYWRLPYRDVLPLGQQPHITSSDVAELGLARVTPSLELCTRLILEAWAYPQRELPLLPWLDLRNLPPQFKELLQQALTAQEERINALKALRAPVPGLVTTVQECAQHTAQALQQCRAFYQHSLSSTNLSSTISSSNALRAQRGLWPVIQLCQDPLELELLGWGNNPQQGGRLTDSEPASALVWEVAEQVGPAFKQELLQQRRTVKFQRREAILRELGLYDERSLNHHPSLNLATYCYDSASGQCYERNQLLRSLVAKRIVLHNCPTTIAAAVHPEHYQGFIAAQAKHCPDLPTPPRPIMPEMVWERSAQLKLLSIDHTKVSDQLSQLYKSPQLQAWEQAPLAFNAATPQTAAAIPAPAPQASAATALAHPLAATAPRKARKAKEQRPTKVEVLQLLLSALPEPADRATQDQFLRWLNAQAPAPQLSHLRDPRLECTLTDALREYWYVRWDGSAGSVPELTASTVLDRMAHKQGLSEQNAGGLVVCPQQSKDPTPENIPSYYQLDLKQFVATTKRQYAPLRQQLRRRLQSYLECRQEHGRSGRVLDVRRAAQLVVGQTDIFKQRSYCADESTALHLLVDCSGSMGQSAANEAESTRLEDTRIYQACSAALTLGLALDRLPGLALMITFFPHTLEDQPYFNVIAPGEHVSAHPERLWHPPYGGTPMDQALNYAAESVLRCRATRSIVVIITDGQPNRPDALLKEVRKAQDCGIEIYGIGINESAGHQYFEHFYDLTDFSNLTAELCRLVSQLFALPEVA